MTRSSSLVLAAQQPRNARIDVLALADRYTTPLTIALTFLIGILDYVTGVEITFVMLAYLVPIVMATWFRGRLFGTFVAGLATAWVTAVFVRAEDLARSLPLVLNGAGAFGMFLAVIWILDLLHQYVEREQQQRRIAVEQLRHAERLNVIGALAAGVAHELGTPLNVIAGTAELLDADAMSHDKVKELSAIVLSQTDKISNIIRHLLDFGRRSGEAKSWIELDCVVGATIALLASTTAKHGCKLSFTPSGESLRVRANSAELEQVLSNLILNATQAMPRGGTVELKTELAVRRDASGVERRFGSISVADAGVGIREDDLPKIFDPFFTTKGVGQGTGLGLSVSYGIVQDHQGSIEVESELGRGTTFAVLLPLA